MPLVLSAFGTLKKNKIKRYAATLHRLGLSVSYDRVLGLSADLGNTIISHFETIGKLCPPTLSNGVYSQHQQWIISTMIQQQQAHRDPFIGCAYHFYCILTMKIVAQSKEALILSPGLTKKWQNYQTVTQLHQQSLSQRGSILFQKFVDRKNPPLVLRVML